MITSLGRCLTSNYITEIPFALNLSETLDSVLSYSRSDSVATYRNSLGKLEQSAINTARFDHDTSGHSLGLLIEGSRINKNTNYNANPTDIMNFVLSNEPAGILSIADDAAQLVADGLNLICTTGRVYKADNTSGASDLYIDIPGTPGNMNPHSLSVYARGVGSGMRAGYLYVPGGQNVNIAPAGGYLRYKAENIIPDSTTRKMRLVVDSGDSIYFILNQYEEGTCTTSTIITTGATATRAQDVISLPSLAAKQFWNQTEGYILARYRPIAILPNDQYPFTAHDGSTSNMIGLRVAAGDGYFNPNVRSGGTAKLNTKNNTAHTIGFEHCSAVTWRSGYAYAVCDGVPLSASYSGDPSGIHTLQIGGRNGGGDTFFGHLSYIEIGKKLLTPMILSQKMKKGTDVNVIGGGQSLMRGVFLSVATNSQAGRKNFLSTLQSVRKGNAAVFLNGATGSSAASKTSNSTNYWWDLATSSRGPALSTFYAAIDVGGTSPDAVIWAQGEEDSHHIGINTTREQYKQCLESLFADMRGRLGTVPVIIQRIGRRNGGYSNTANAGIQVIREVQQELIDAHDWIYCGPEIYDLTLYDQVHLDDAGFATIGSRNARVYLAVLGENAVGTVGPHINGATRSGATITVTLTHDGGTDFSPSSGIEGFKFLNNSTPIAITAAVRSNAVTVTLTLATTPTAGSEILYYGYDDMAGVNAANIIRDNAAIPLPLRTAKIVL